MICRFALAALLTVAVAAPASTYARQSQDPQPQNQQPQQPQSLGEVARQARKAKEDRAKQQAATSQEATSSVLTDDNMATHKGPSPTAAVGGLDNPHSALQERFASARQSFDEAEQTLNQLAPLDQAALAQIALEGRTVDFPGRAAWEQKLFANKQAYVAHGRQLLIQARTALHEVETAAANHPSPSDSHMQDLAHRLREIMQDALQTESNFQAVVLEGQNLAKAASH